MAPAICIFAAAFSMTSAQEFATKDFFVFRFPLQTRNGIAVDAMGVDVNGVDVLVMDDIGAVETVVVDVAVDAVVSVVVIVAAT